MRPLEEGHLLLAGSYVNGATLDVRYADPRALPLRFATVRPGREVGCFVGGNRPNRFVALSRRWRIVSTSQHAHRPESNLQD